MALRSQKRTRTAIVVALWLALAPSLLAQKEPRFEVRHDHWRKAGVGTLVISDHGISFQESSKKKAHAGRWQYEDIQELRMSPDRLILVTYKDRKWRLGADQEYEFTLAPGQSFQEAYERLKDRLDQRFVAALPDPELHPLWEIPVKLQGRVTGSEGVLLVGSDRVVYKADEKGQSRTWRYRDIENISTSGPFQLTVTTYERSKWHYGNLKGFNFQLKQRLEEKRYDLLWRRLNREKGLQLLTSIQERDNNQ